MKNHGEPSYVTRIDLFLPVNTHLKLHVNDQCKHMPVGLIGEFIYSCKLSTNPLKTSKSVRAFQLFRGKYLLNNNARMRLLGEDEIRS